MKTEVATLAAQLSATRKFAKVRASRGLMMRIPKLTAIACLVALNASAGEQPKAAAIAVDASEAVVELVSIDRSARVAVVRGPQGGTLTVELPAEAQNLDRVKPGDKFKMRYVEALALDLRKGGSASASELQTVELAPKGGTPGGRVTRTKQVTAVVGAIDRSKRTVAVKGPGGNTVSLKVRDEVRSFDEIAVGDTISLTYTEAVMMQMITK